MKIAEKPSARCLIPFEGPQKCLWESPGDTSFSETGSFLTGFPDKAGRTLFARVDRTKIPATAKGARKIIVSENDRLMSI
ncbi:hypothetical protein ES703_76527 [subsurface metagenome]